jgi:aryl-alcohol dehydrogenase-like predicted oxidoreductase
MDSRILGRTGIKVSQLCFGTMSFGDEADPAEAAKLYAACRDAGINFFDCANVYSLGKAEEILGGLIAGERDRLVITSKCASKMSDDINDLGASRRHIMLSVEASLRRLKTDRLDVLFLHRWDPTTPLEESLRALEDLQRAGKILHAGTSNYAAWQIAKGLGIAAGHGWAGFDVIQPMYNLAKRQAEVEILPLAEAERLGVISYGPLGGGLLTGKYGPDRRPEQGRLLSNESYAARYREDWVYEVASAFTAFAQARGFHPVSLGVAWAAAHPAVTCPIIGARNVEQLKPSLASVEVDMTAELHAEIAALSRTPAPATDRLEEQA